MTDISRTTPLPCPFCGSTPAVGDCRGEEETGERYGYSYVECPATEHSALVHADTVESALTIWNRRAA